MHNYINIPTSLVVFNQIVELTEIRKMYSGREANIITGKRNPDGRTSAAALSVNPYARISTVNA